MPSHVEAAWSVAVEQVEAPHTFPEGCSRQPPAPSHVPSVWQVEASIAAQVVAGVGGTPAGTNVHVPALPMSPHDLQPPSQAVAQQKPSSQNFESQSVASAQGEPIGSAPHVPFTQGVRLAHSSFVVHDVRQTKSTAEHWYGRHGWGGG